MKIVFPVENDRGVESPVYGHFGSAPCFIMVDTETAQVEPLVNKDADHKHGQCQPLKALGGTSIGAVVVGGIGAGALNQLQAAGIRVYRAIEGTVQDNLGLVRSGRLPEFTAKETCAGHSASGGCAHG